MTVKLRILISILGVMAIIQIVNMLSGYSLLKFGLFPRNLDGLLGILFAPWMHVSVSHFIGNGITFFVLGWLCLSHSVRYFTYASIFIITVSGLVVWLLGRSAIHVGASGWIFGLWALLMANAYFNCTIKNLFIGLMVLFLYGGLVFGMLPSDTTSFEGHIAGAFSGVLFAWLAHRKDESVSTQV